MGDHPWDWQTGACLQASVCGWATAVLPGSMRAGTRQINRRG